MNSPAEDIANILADEGIGTIATDLFCFEMPSDPDECICTYDTGGFPPQAGYRYDYPTVQIIVRGRRGGYRDIYTIAESIKVLLHGKANFYTDSPNRIVAIWAMGDIITLGNDESGRPLLSLNFRIHRTES